MKKLFLMVIATLALIAGDEKMLPATNFAEIPKGAKMIEFGAESCYSCQQMGKLLYKLKQEDPSLPLYFVNVMKQRDVAFEYKIRMIPTQIFFDKNNSVIYRHIGMLKKEEILKLLKENR